MSFRELARALVRRADRHAERLWAKRDRRAQRGGRYFGRVRVAGWSGQVYVSAKRAAEESRASARVLDLSWWREQLRDPRGWFDPARATLCKDSHSAQVARVCLPLPEGELPIIAKRPIARNWRRRLRQLLPPSRSMRGWRIANALLNRDVPTARPLAVLERRAGPFVLDQVLLTETVAGAVDLPSHLQREREARSPRSWSRHKRQLALLLARHLRQFFERGFAHRDCKAENLLVLTIPKLKLLWIDMDGIRRSRRPAIEEQCRALVRLHVSLLDVPGLTNGDRVRFLRAFLTRFGMAPNAWRSIWRRVAADSSQKLAARRRHRAWKQKHYGRA